MKTAALKIAPVLFLLNPYFNIPLKSTSGHFCVPVELR